MSNKTSQNVTKITPYKAEQYQKFIELVGNGEIPEHWEILAEALGVTRQTIARWREYPEFQEAINKGINECLEQMKIVGRKDWKMWRERLSLMRNEAGKDAVTINADKVIAILGGGSVPSNDSD